MSHPEPSLLETGRGQKLAYCKSEGGPVTVIFLGGMMSDKQGAKAVFLEGVCRNQGWGYIRFDYSGHGSSSGNFREGTIGSWLGDAVSIIDHLSEGPLVLVGSSLGGWLALLAALARPGRVKGLVCLAPAVDFTERLLPSILGQELMKEMEEKGEIQIPSEYGDKPYIFTKALFDEGRDHLLLDGPINLDLPVGLLHGMKDTDVPHWISEKFMARLAGGDKKLVLLEGAGHRLSSPAELEQIKTLLEDVVEKAAP